MRCKQIAKQTRGEVTEIELEGLRCNRAGICRRKGICALSPYARPELVPPDEANAPAAVSWSEPGQLPPTSFEVLKFKYSLGFHWVKANNVESAVQVIDGQPADEQPRIVRRVEYFRLPD